MKSTALSRIDPSIVVSLVAGGVLLAAIGTSTAFVRAVALAARAAWMYVSNTRG